MAAGHEDPLQFLKVVAQLARIADADRIALAALDRHGQVLAADGDLDHVLHVADVHAVAGDLLAVDPELDVGLADDAVGDHVGRAGRLLEDLLDLQADPLDLLQVAAVRS